MDGGIILTNQGAGLQRASRNLGAWLRGGCVPVRNMPPV